MWLRKAVRAVVDTADAVAGVLLLLIVGLNLVAIFMRYVLLGSLSWSEEVMRYASIWVTFLAAAAVSWRGEHMSLALLADVRSPAFQRVYGVVLHLLMAAFASVLLWQGLVYVGRNGMQTAPTTGVPMVWAYGAIVVGAALLLLVELFKVIEAAAGWQRPHEDDENQAIEDQP